MLKPGDTVLGMNLAHGGHLTHGHPLNFSGQALHDRSLRRPRRDDERIDYDEFERLAHEHKPKMIMVGASAYPRIFDFERIGRIADEVGAPVMTDMAHIAGLVAAGASEPGAALRLRDHHHPQDAARTARRDGALPRAVRQGPRQAVFPGVQGGPLMHVIAAKAVCFKEALEPEFKAYQRRSSPTPSARRGPAECRVPARVGRHRQPPDAGRRVLEGLTGKVAEAALDRAGITVNKNAIPFDKNPPMVASGIRIGTPPRPPGGGGGGAKGGEPGGPPAPPRGGGGRGGGGGGGGSPGPAGAPPGGGGERPRAGAAPGPGGAAGPRGPPPGRGGGGGGPAAAVSKGFRKGGVLLAEAGTGTGKTLAYLIPAILSGHRVLVSTGTKNLQEQIYFKDLPVLREALGVPFTATYMKGRGNYLCLHRFETWRDNGALKTIDETRSIRMIDEWSRESETGDRAELEDLPEDAPFWPDISGQRGELHRRRVPLYCDCFVTKMRQRAAASDVVIVNHHLLCADAAVRQNAYGEVIPSCERAVIDEAHQLEDVATQYFGRGVSNYRIEALARDLDRAATSDLISATGRRPPICVPTSHGFAITRACSSRPCSCSGSKAAPDPAATRAYESPRRHRESREAGLALVGALDAVEADIALTKDISEEVLAMARRAGEARDDIKFLLRADDPDYVYFLETRGRGVYLRASPIDVSYIIREVLLDRMKTLVFTSATLTSDGSFEYFRSRLGVGDADEIRLDSEFDYARQAILYLPRKMPDPRSPQFIQAASRRSWRS